MDEGARAEMTDVGGGESRVGEGLSSSWWKVAQEMPDGGRRGCGVGVESCSHVGWSQAGGSEGSVMRVGRWTLARRDVIASSVG